MKPNKKVLIKLLAPAMLVAFLMSFTLNVNESPKGDESATSSELALDDAKDHCCCPPGWTLAGLSGPNDPAAAKDNNGDGIVCAKGFQNTSHPSNGTPKGKGNYSFPDFNQSSINVKDNNKPCSDDQYNPCN